MRNDDGAPTDRSVPSTGPHANNLKRLWAKGRLSSAEVQSLAASAEASGATGLNRLTKAGKSGAQPQHLFKQLNHIFGYPKGAAPIDWVEIPTIRSRKEPHPMLMPHRFLQELYKHRQDLWQSRILGDASAPEVFWQGMSQSLFVKEHPYLPREVWAKTIPLGFHGGGWGLLMPKTVCSL
jgi:hypothetical protein